MSQAANFFRLYGRNIRQVPRIPTVLVFGIMMPVIQLLLFGSIFKNAVQTSANNYYEYIAPAIILLTCFLGMANASAALIVDLRTGYFDKLRTTPTSPAMVIVARLLAEMTRVFGQATLILLISFALGARFNTGILGAIVLLIACVLFSAMTTGLMTTALAMKTKSDQATQSAFPLFFIFIFLSTAYVPKALLPKWLQHVVEFNPVDYMIVGTRELILGSWGPALEKLGIGFAIATLVMGLLIFANIRAYRTGIQS